MLVFAELRGERASLMQSGRRRVREGSESRGGNGAVCEDEMARENERARENRRGVERESAGTGGRQRGERQRG